MSATCCGIPTVTVCGTCGWPCDFTCSRCGYKALHQRCPTCGKAYDTNDDRMPAYDVEPDIEPDEVTT